MRVIANSFTLSTALAALTLAASVVSGVAVAGEANYPAKPINMVVPFSAGGFTDILARRFADEMSKTLGQPIIIENRVGASGVIGANYVSKAKPDGYTLLFETPDTIVTAPMLMEGVQYEPSDFEQVSLLVQQPLVLAVSGSSPYKTLPAVIEAAKERPGELTYATWGNGSSAHIASSALSNGAGITMNHIPYKGVSPALNDLMAGRIDTMYVGMLSTVDYSKDNKIIPIAINRVERSPKLPNVPTLEEAGVSVYPIGLWYALGVPTGTPQPVIDKIYEAAQEAGQSDILDWLSGLGMDVPVLDPQATAEFMAEEITNWESVIQDSGISVGAQ